MSRKRRDVERFNRGARNLQARSVRLLPERMIAALVIGRTGRRRRGK
jgi:hypothetical protein